MADDDVVPAESANPNYDQLKGHDPDGEAEADDKQAKADAADVEAAADADAAAKAADAKVAADEWATPASTVPPVTQ